VPRYNLLYFHKKRVSLLSHTYSKARLSHLYFIYFLMFPFIFAFSYLLLLLQLLLG